MFNQVNWATVVFSLIPVLSTLAGIWLTQRYQFKIKRVELESQAKLRARELLFTAYQKRIDDGTKQAENIGRVFGQFIELLQREKDPPAQQEAWNAIACLMTVSKDSLLIWVRELESELQENQLEDIYKDDIVLIKATLAIDFDNIKLEQVGKVYMEFMRTLALIYSIRDALSDKRSKNLFVDYLKD
jgi:hypothetical protein